MKILVTGGAGFIGSHTVLELIKSGHSVVVVDNLSNSSKESLNRVEKILDVEEKLSERNKIEFYESDIRDRESLNNIFENHIFDCVIHFAGLKAVGESVLKPWEYYDNNINGTLILIDVMRKHGCKNIIFSSSCNVYGAPEVVPITEECPTGKCTNPYGQTKFMLEEILTDMHTADVKNNNSNPWNIVLLRYFNLIGAHPSGLIGENPNGIPNNLMPYITQVAIGKLDHLTVFGNDYNTSDGTGVRDYIHVVDLAKGHVKALKAIKEKCGVAVYNLGTGKGYSVLDLINAFEESNGIKVKYVIGERRPGDIAETYSNPAKAEKELGWKAEFGIEDMVRDSWNWQIKNPNGY